MTPPNRPDAARAFLALHSGPGLILPNTWDAGSARILEQVGFPAIATTSAGVVEPDTIRSLARAALSLLERAGRELLDAGTLGFLDGAISYAELQRRFGEWESGSECRLPVSLGGGDGERRQAGRIGRFS